MSNKSDETYESYLKNIYALLDLPAELQERLNKIEEKKIRMIAECRKKAENAKQELLRKRASLEDEYGQLQTMYSEIGVNMPKRLRPSGNVSNISLSDACEKQRKLAVVIRQTIQNYKNESLQKEAESRNAALALERRKQMLLEKAKREEEERLKEEKRRKEEEERLRKLEEEEKRRLEEQRRLEEERKKKIKTGIIAAVFAVLVILVLIFLTTR